MTALVWNSVGAAKEAPVGFLRRVEVDGAAVCLGKTAEGWVAFLEDKLTGMEAEFMQVYKAGEGPDVGPRTV